MENFNMDTENLQLVENGVTQEEQQDDQKIKANLFNELQAYINLENAATEAVEEKLREIVQRCGNTFAHSGEYAPLQDKPVIQIRSRFSPSKERTVPYIVGLKSFPKEWSTGAGPRKQKNPTREEVLQAFEESNMDPNLIEEIIE